MASAVATGATPAPRALLRHVFALWALCTALACVIAYQRAHIDAAPGPSAPAQRWALQALRAGCEGKPLPEAPEEARSYVAALGVVAQAWDKGQVSAREVGTQLVPTVQAAARRFAAEPALQGLDCSAQLRFTVSVDRGRAPLVRDLPVLSALNVVPLLDGLTAELSGKRAYVTPDELAALGLYDHVVTPVPDLAFGLNLDAALAALAKQLGTKTDQLLQRGSVERYRAFGVVPAVYPSHERPTAANLAKAARQGAEFLLRHQRRDGRYAYVYYAGIGDTSPDHAYNLPRHSGTTYFLAQADRVLDMPEARTGALRALRYLARSRLRRCGDPAYLCIENKGQADIGSAALTAAAAAEVLRRGEDPVVRRMLVGLTAFIRSMQRPDGELMHVYDLVHDRAIDVQRMYYSGEAAYALLRAHDALRDDRNLEVARKLMRHLTGAGWSFFGSRYFYGEEHWTCQAVAQAAPLLGVAKDDPGLDFCTRWLAFQRKLQYAPGQTPWPVAGAIGVGPLLVPRLTTVSSRAETGAMLYPVLRRLGHDVAPLRAQVEASLSFLMRMRYAPGPVHLLADPAAALGAIPGSPASLDVRNDFVQHAGSAMLLWLEATSTTAARSPQ